MIHVICYLSLRDQVTQQMINGDACGGLSITCSSSLLHTISRDTLGVLQAPKLGICSSDVNKRNVENSQLSTGFMDCLIYWVLGAPNLIFRPFHLDFREISNGSFLLLHMDRVCNRERSENRTCVGGVSLHSCGRVSQGGFQMPIIVLRI